MVIVKYCSKIYTILIEHFVKLDKVHLSWLVVSIAALPRGTNVCRIDWNIVVCQALVCHHKVCTRPFSQQTKAHTYLYAKVWLVILLTKNIHDLPTQYLANFTFETSLPFQMMEEIMLDCFCILYFGPSSRLIFALHNFHCQNKNKIKMYSPPKKNKKLMFWYRCYYPHWLRY